MLAVRAGLTYQSKSRPVHYELCGEPELIFLKGVCTRL